MKPVTTPVHRLPTRRYSAILPLIALVGLMVSTFGFPLLFRTAATVKAAAAALPCDIYASGGTPCVAAHSTVRALYSAYTGNLYQVKRASDTTTRDIGVLSAGGFANAAAQDAFCTGTTCVITIIYDQSGRGNNLTPAPGGGYIHTPDQPANATKLPLTVGGHKVYGVYIDPGMGYRDDSTSGIATGDNAEGEYAIFDGTHYDGGCCFDYGNAETSNNDTGSGHMEAIYFGNLTAYGTGAGPGPWVMGDLENGVYSGSNPKVNSGDQTITSHYVTAMLKGAQNQNQWVLKAGDAQSGGLTTMYSGIRPTLAGYYPMHKEGAILLGIGGDNSNSSAGSFFEGAMTSGYPSDATEAAVQANIVAAGYGPALTSGYAINAGGASTGAFAADGYYSGGQTYATTASIDTSGVTNPAPQGVYQTERYGNFTYTLPHLLPGAQYTVRLHFAENYWTSSGQRLFNAFINGQQVLTNFDIFVAAGGANKAIVESYTATADSTGTITIQFTTVKDNAKVSGIEASFASYAVNAGGSAAGSFAADAFGAGGQLHSWTASVDTSGVTNPAPQAVYQTERYGTFSYAIPGLTPGGTYTVRLHFSENTWASSGQRVFNVAINGTQVLANFDIYAATGAENKAIVKPFTATADSGGTVTVQFSTVVNNAKVDGIEILAG